MPEEPLPPLDVPGKTPGDIWHDYFSRNRPEPAVLGNMLVRLHDDGRHEHVIAAIESAMLHGHAQPWMYEVLALEMEIAGRPKSDIERVLFSAIDFTATDYPNMMASAAYLVRFGRREPALHLYRQASRLQPSRPEPYVLGLKLARDLKDYDAVGWAAAGILMYAWTSNHKTLHREAEDAILASQQELRSADRVEEAGALGERLAAARQRDLVLRLTWSGDGDVDLIVEEPLGTVCSYEHPHTAGGGVLVHDGYGPKQDDCYEQYVCAFGAPGNYRVRVRHVWGDVVGKRAQLTVIRYQGTSKEDGQTFTVPLGTEDQVVRVSLQEGRRTELSAVPARQTARTVQPGGRKPRPQILAQAGGQGAQQAVQSFQQSRGVISGAVGYTPIISVIPEGVSLSALAVVSGDRRYVRMTLNPVFSNITDVFTFSFAGGAPAGNPGGAAGGGNPAGGN